MDSKKNIAVVIPCYNEENAIGVVIKEFMTALPEAIIYVFDNNSTDASVEVAKTHGAVVHYVSLQGKGNVVRRMFSDIEADVYVLVDGDDTYHAASARSMVDKLFSHNLDMVIGCRVTDEKEAYRPGHRFGNWLLTDCVARLFGRTFTDILSGYRVFSRRFVKSFPSLSSGFEIETELTIHALELRMATYEIKTPYKSRPEGTASKLNTFRDGFRILFTIFKLFRMERPLLFFNSIGTLLAILFIILMTPLILAYSETGQVLRLPTAVLSTGIGILSALSFTCGFILDTVTQGRHEVKRLAYLRIPAPKE